MWCHMMKAPLLIHLLVHTYYTLVVEQTAMDMMLPSVHSVYHNCPIGEAQTVVHYTPAYSQMV